MTDHIAWSDRSPREKESAVLALAKIGLSSGQIARQLATPSRNSIITVIQRLQKAALLPPAQPHGSARRSASQRPKPPKPKPAKPAKPSKIMEHLPGGAPKVNRFDFKGRSEQRAASPGIVIRKEDAFDPIPGTEPKPFGSPGCKWPVDGLTGRGRFACGRPKATEHAYCAAHNALAHYSPRIPASRLIGGTR